MKTQHYCPFGSLIRVSIYGAISSIYFEPVVTFQAFFLAKNETQERGCTCVSYLSTTHSRTLILTMIPQTMSPSSSSKQQKYYSYEDLLDEVDEILSDDDDISEYSLSSGESSSEDNEDGKEWLSTIAEETSFDLRTRQTLDSLSIASQFDDLDEDCEEDDNNDLEYLQSMEQRLQAMKLRLQQFAAANDDDDDDESIISEGDDSNSDIDIDEELNIPPPMQRALCLKSMEKDYVRTTSQSTGTTWENLSSSSSSSSSAEEEEEEDEDNNGVVDHEEDAPTEPPATAATAISVASTMKDSQKMMVHSPRLPFNPLDANNKKQRWIGTNIEFSNDRLAESELSVLDTSVSYTSAHSIVSTSMEWMMQTPLSPKVKNNKCIVLPGMPQLDEDIPSTPTTSSSSSCNSSPNSQKSNKTKSSSLRKNKTRAQCLEPLTPPRFVSIATTVPLEEAYQKRQQKRETVKAKLQALQDKIETLLSLQ